MPIDDLSVPPTENERYRCTACNGLTRFTVVRATRAQAYYHFTIGGELQIEDPKILTDVIESIDCVWCGTGKNIVKELLPVSADP